MLFSEHIRLLRKERNVPQRQLATAIGVDVPMYCRYEHGERHPKREQVVKLARLLGADRGELVAEWLAEHALSAIGHDPMSAHASELLLQRLGGTPAPAAVPAAAPAAPDPLADAGHRLTRFLQQSAPKRRAYVHQMENVRLFQGLRTASGGIGGRAISA